MQAAVLETQIPSPVFIAASDPSCAHCGAAVPPGRLAGASERSFCCGGCETIYSAIHATGLGAFYGGRELDAGKARPGRPSGRNYLDFDAPGVAQPSEADGSARAELHLEGLHCAACVWLVESLPRVTPGVREARLDFGRALLEVRWNPEMTSLGAIARQLDALGYTPHRTPSAASSSTTVERSLLMRLGVAGAIAGNVMLMALALYSGAAADLDWNYAAFFRWSSLIVSLPSLFYCAAVFYRGAWASLRARVPNMDLPIAVGITAGFASGAVNTVRGSGEVYFDTITTLIFLLLVGRWLTARQHRRASTAAQFAQALAPATARLVSGDELREVRADGVEVGALVEVRAGERIPVDGRVERGESAIDARLLTGESDAVEVKPGDRVYAGTENVAASLRVRVEQSGNATRVGQLVRAMERAQRERAPIVRVADSIAGYFVVVILLLAAATFAIWWRIDPALAVDHVVALLVVTCPCALGMATPLAVSVALARAARRGILFKSGEALEVLSRPVELVFDKTGTLTRGRPELVEWQGSPALAERVSVAERGCDHPLARAFQRVFPARDGLVPEFVERSNGAGVRARVDGHDIAVGKPDFLQTLGVEVPLALLKAAAAFAARGLSPVLIAEDGQVRGLAGFGDTLRSDAAPSLEALARMGCESRVLSGDHPLVVERVCRELPVSAWRGAVSPEQKLEEVAGDVRRGRRVVMIGDGLNDAAAMSAASVGFAVHGGAEASLLAASVFSTEPGVAPVLEAVRGARATLHVIYRGIGFSLAYNLLGVGLAMSGLLSPLLAAVLMPLSSLTVVSSALRSRAFTAPRPALEASTSGSSS